MANKGNPLILLAKTLLLGFFLLCFSVGVFAHYPILDCNASSNGTIPKRVTCEASFSNLAKAPNVLMEVYSEEDEIVATGKTNTESIFVFPEPEGVYFIIMDAGPGHVLEISDEEVTKL
jgi:hypothetical protein